MMDLDELLKFVVIVVLLQGLIGGFLYFSVRGAPGVDFGTFTLPILLMILISVTVGAFLFWLVKRYSKERAIRTAMLAMSEDEEKVLSLVMNNGEIRQDDLRREVDFSKSKLSALLNNLEDKEAIEKERYKRTNIIRPTEEFQR